MKWLTFEIGLVIGFICAWVIHRIRQERTDSQESSRKITVYQKVAEDTKKQISESLRKYEEEQKEMIEERLKIFEVARQHDLEDNLKLVENEVQEAKVRYGNVETQIVLKAQELAAKTKELEDRKVDFAALEQEWQAKETRWRTEESNAQQKLVELRDTYESDLAAYERAKIDTKKRMIERYRNEREREIQDLSAFYEAEKTSTLAAIELVQKRLADWSNTERVAYEERAQRDENQKQNRLVLSDRSIRELRELYEACGRLQLSNPLPLYKAIYDLYLKGPVKELGTRLGVVGLSGIYKITNVVDGKVYVGQSVDIAERWKQHIKRGTRCDSGTLVGASLYEAMWEEGIWNFSFQVLEFCRKEDLNELEKRWIGLFQSNEIGYNKKI